MAEIVQMPQLGESVTEGTIGRWLKKEGDTVEKYESLLEVETDKVNAEVPSPVAGTLKKILVSEGTTVAIGTAIAEMEVAGAPAASPAQPAASEPASEPEARPAAEAPQAAAPQAAAPQAQHTEGRGRYSPAVRRLAAEHHIDPGQVSGTGAGGRVTRQDILQAMESGAAQAPVGAAKAPAQAAVAGAKARVSAEDKVVPLSQIRKTIAEHMVQSKATVPHAWMMTEADVTGLVRLRDKLKGEFQSREGVSLTYLPFMLRAAIQGLRSVPTLNAQWNGDSIVYKKRINLGVATATERGLVVPVIPDADQKNIVGLTHALADITERARSGHLTLADIEGGTFTVDNAGSVGVLLTYPIINAPEVAIVTMEAIVKRPVVIGDAIAIRSMVNICCSFDHRVVDGADAGKFLQVVRRELEAFTPETSIF